MSNQYFDSEYKTPDPIEETVIDMNDQVQNPDPYTDAIPLAAAQIEPTVKETENQFLNQDPYTDAIPLAAAQIKADVAEPEYVIQDRNRFEEEFPVDTDDNDEETKESNVIVIDPMNVPVSDEFPVIDAPFKEVPNSEFDTTNDLLEETIPAGILVGYSLVDEKPVQLEDSLVETPEDVEMPAASMESPKVTLGNLEDSQLFQKRWNEIQSQFVDDPKDAVMQADVLVSEIIEQIKQRFDNEHATLKNTWVQSNMITTEDLRTTLRKYHNYVDLLLV